MERREGELYAFNEPLLETALREAGEAGICKVVVALQFLFAGRHAGPDGDIAKICEEASREYPNLDIEITNPIGERPEVLELLWHRWAQVR